MSILNKKKVNNTEIDKIIIHNRFENSENELRRVPIESENSYLEKIRKGLYKEVQFSDFSQIDQSMGSGVKDPKKKWEYVAVAAIALESRTAIKGGLNPDVAFDIADAMMQRLERSTTIAEIHEILDELGYRLAFGVYESRKKKSTYIMDLCKGYISRNIFKKIRMDELAAYVGVHPSYLSKVFHKYEGITLQEYIQKEKMQVAGNLLKNSDRSITEIAQYMGIPSHSDFSAKFKRFMGMTPKEFRNAYRTDVFYE